MKTVSLELAKQLFNSGYTKSSFYWCNDGESNHWYIAHCPNGVNEEMLGTQLYPAPTTEEIFDLLPGLTEPEHGKHVWIQMHKNRDKSYTIKFMDMRISSQIKQGVFNKSLADAAAKRWLYLKKEGLI